MFHILSVDPGAMNLFVGGADITSDEGVLFEPFIERDSIGYLVTAPDGTARIVRLVPSTSHEFNPDNGAIADIFVYDDEVDDARGLPEQEPFSVVTYINLFPEKE